MVIRVVASNFSALMGYIEQVENKDTIQKRATGAKIRQDVLVNLTEVIV